MEKFDFFAKMVSPFIATVLNKHFQNKPRLIMHYGHISSHKMPSPSGYPINILKLNNKPNKMLLDRQYRNQIPIIIKTNDEVWMYGYDASENTQLVQLDNKNLYESIQCAEDITQIRKISDEIYNDILASNAHISKMYINAHSLVVRNEGGLRANNVRISHKMLPEYDANVSLLPGVGKELLIPIIIPGEQVVISYMYFAPTQYTDINLDVKSDEGFATFIEVISVPVPSGLQKAILYILLFIGSSTVIYFGITSVGYFYKYITM